MLFRVIVLAAVVISAPTVGVSADAKPADIPSLITALEDANVRYGASLALTKHGTKAVPALRNALKSEKQDVPVWAAYTLGQIGPDAKSAVSDLVTALSNSDDALRAAAAQSLGRIGPSAAGAVDPLAKALSDPKPAVRTRAAVALGRIGPSAKDSAPNLIAVLSDSRLRKVVRTALIQIGPQAVNALRKSLKDDRTRFDVANLMLQVDPKTAKQLGLDKTTAADLPSLQLVLNDPTRSTSERTSAATAIASLGRVGVPVLIAAFDKEDLSETAAKAFAKVGAVAVPEVIKAVASKNPGVRSAAADALGYIGPAAHSAAPQLIQLLSDGDSNVRYRAVRALHQFGPKAKPAIPALVKIIHNERESETTRQWAIKSLIVTLPETHDVVVKELIAASKLKKNYGVSQLARQSVRRIDPKAAEAAGVK